MRNNLVEVNNLKKYFPIKGGLLGFQKSHVKAVDDVSFNVKQGEVLGLVGESGCGKTTLVNTLLRLEEPTSGSVLFDGIDIFSEKQSHLRQVRKNMQIVFQDPFWSLNPRYLVKDIIGEPLKVHKKLSNREFFREIEEALEMVGMSKKAFYKYPHEFSGGFRQRIAIARALALKPKLVVLDEPTSSIDIISQAQVLDLLSDLKKELNLTYVLISHDLSVVKHMADRIAVMYLGKLAEIGTEERIFRNPSHPYTEALMASIPDLETSSPEELVELKGSVPSAINPPPGCRFHTRCPKVIDECKKREPEMIEVEEGQEAACILLKEKAGV